MKTKANPGSSDDDLMQQWNVLWMKFQYSLSTFLKKYILLQVSTNLFIININYNLVQFTKHNEEIYCLFFDVKKTN